MSPDVLRIADPPRRVPPGTKLAILNHRDVTGSLNWSIPAAVCLLLSAIARPEWPARIALMVTGTICLVLSTRRALPQLRRGFRSIQRMRSGVLTLGRIVAIDPPWPGPMKPFAQFLQQWDGEDARASFEDASGCLFRVVAIVFGFPLTIFFVMLVSSGIYKLLGGNVTGLTLQFVRGAVGMLILFGSVFVAAAAIVKLFSLWRYGEAPAQHPSDPPRDVQALRQELLAVKPAPEGRDFPEDHPIMVRCQVQYPGLDHIHLVETQARLCPRLSRSGVEPLLFQPAAPDEIDLLEALPPEAKIIDGAWAAAPAAGPVFALLVAGAVFLAALGALAFEGYSLALR